MTEVIKKHVGTWSNYHYSLDRMMKNVKNALWTPTSPTGIQDGDKVTISLMLYTLYIFFAKISSSPLIHRSKKKISYQRIFKIKCIVEC